MSGALSASWMQPCQGVREIFQNPVGNAEKKIRYIRLQGGQV